MKNKNSLIKIHSPIDDAYIMGKIPEAKGKVNACIDKVKAMRYLCDESIAQLEDQSVKDTKAKVNACIDKVKAMRYLCDESINQQEELKEELNKL